MKPMPLNIYNIFRPYGLEGEPLPWSSKSRIVNKSKESITDILKRVRNIVSPLIYIYIYSYWIGQQWRLEPYRRWNSS